MAASPFVPTFTGFVATTVDAALLVQAAIAGRLPHVATRPDNVRYRQLARSGTVVVFGPGIQRWREGLSWTPRRALGNGFDVYREKTSTGARLSDTDKWKERLCREVLAPFVGPNVADGTCKRRGLVKKTIAFTIGGQRWGVVAYYNITDAAYKVLRRPRDDPALGQMLLAGGLSPEFWNQGAQRSARARVVVMVDDGNAHPASRSPFWVRAQPVDPGQFVPFVGFCLRPSPVPSQQLALSAAGGNFAAPSVPTPSAPVSSVSARSAPVPVGPARSAPAPSSSRPVTRRRALLGPVPLPGPDGSVEIEIGTEDWLAEVPRLLDEMFPPPLAAAAAGDAEVGDGGGVVNWEKEAARVMEQIALEGELEFTEEEVLRFMGGGMDGDGDVVMEDV
ncbi:hypothetical protein NEMBOFW57_000500 [Staphylotrichum longicolle]|uniref:Uncharacterized protein n=1 Tax=Staphylotrichum longicolle TaxID=669026 RepID=A0AAD4F483_9PEZI|nr:hypothetical protein NEMBOFW57_000500 [Staphylotrichum longicolle]